MNEVLDAAFDLRRTAPSVGAKMDCLSFFPHQWSITGRAVRDVGNWLTIRWPLGDIHTRAVNLNNSNGLTSQKNDFKSLQYDGSPLTQLLADLKSLLNLLGSRKLSKIEQMVWPRKCAKLDTRLNSIANQRRILMEKVLVDTGSVRAWG